MTPKNLFGDELRRLRKAASLSLAELADAAGCSIVHVSDVERGKKNPPQTAIIEKMLKRMRREEQLPKMLVLAAQSRRSIEISVERTDANVASMLVALARRCDEGQLDPETARKIREILDK